MDENVDVDVESEADPSTHTSTGPSNDTGKSQSLALKIPLPTRSPIAPSASLYVRVSSTDGLIEIVDTGSDTASGRASSGDLVDASAGAGAGASGALASSSASAERRGTEARGRRVKMACHSVNEGKTRLGDDLGRLVTAVS